MFGKHSYDGDFMKLIAPISVHKFHLFFYFLQFENRISQGKIDRKQGRLIIRRTFSFASINIKFNHVYVCMYVLAYTGYLQITSS